MWPDFFELFWGYFVYTEIWYLSSSRTTVISKRGYLVFTEALMAIFWSENLGRNEWLRPFAADFLPALKSRYLVYRILNPRSREKISKISERSASFTLHELEPFHALHDLHLLWLQRNLTHSLKEGLVILFLWLYLNHPFHITIPRLYQAHKSRLALDGKGIEI